MKNIKETIIGVFAGAFAINKVTGEVKAYVFKLNISNEVIKGVKTYTPKEVVYGEKG